MQHFLERLKTELYTSLLCEKGLEPVGGNENKEDLESLANICAGLFQSHLFLACPSLRPAATGPYHASVPSHLSPPVSSCLSGVSLSHVLSPCILDQSSSAWVG